VYSGKLILAAIYLRRVGIDGRSYAAAPTQVSTVVTPLSLRHSISAKASAALPGRCVSEQIKYSHGLLKNSLETGSTRENKSGGGRRHCCSR
jgi:hypothetical protein